MLNRSVIKYKILEIFHEGNFKFQINAWQWEFLPCTGGRNDCFSNREVVRVGVSVSNSLKDTHSIIMGSGTEWILYMIRAVGMAFSW